MILSTTPNPISIPDGKPCFVSKDAIFLTINKNKRPWRIKNRLEDFPNNEIMGGIVKIDKEKYKVLFNFAINNKYRLSVWVNPEDVTINVGRGSKKRRILLTKYRRSI